MNDEKLMKRCIEIGQSVLGLTYPNPNVGSLLFCDGKIISEGFTSRAGGNHSEINTIINVKSNVIQLISEKNYSITLRPSGTEPQIKFDFSLSGDDSDSEADRE